MEDSFFYGASGAEIRGRVVFDGSTADPPVNAWKRRIAVRDTPIGAGFAARLCASVEEPAAPRELPRVVVPHRVSLARRRSFTLPGGEFRFDCSEAWAAASRSEAVGRRASGMPPACSIEVEVLRPIDYLKARGNCGCDVLALSMLSKLADLVELDRYDLGSALDGAEPLVQGGLVRGS